MQFDTAAIHGPHDVGETLNAAVSPPVVTSTTFRRGSDGQYLSPYVYSRSNNPNREALERTLAALEGGAEGACEAFAFASGSAATLAVFQACLQPGHRVVLPEECYYGTAKLAREVAAPGMGLDLSFVDLSDTSLLRGAVAPVAEKRARLLWVETPGNPTLRITDIGAAAEAAHEAGALLAVDNTWPTPLLTRPMEHDADIVVHSTSKYIGGHSDLIGGAVVVGPRASERAGFDVAARLRSVQRLGGAVPSPSDCYLALRGLKTLAVRVRAQSATASALAGRLSRHPAVSVVRYPGLADHPGHAVAARQMRDAGRGGQPCFGAMLAIRVKGGRDAALRVAGATRLFAQATSLGGVESLIEHRASVEDYRTPTPDDLLRLSIGLEDENDLWDDLGQALG